MRLHIAPETGGPRGAPTTVVFSRALGDGSLLRSAGPAITAAVVTATIFGACVMQVTRRDDLDDSRSRLDEDTLNASAQPASVRAAPIAEAPAALLDTPAEEQHGSF